MLSFNITQSGFMELKDFTDMFSLFNALFTLLLPCLKNLTFMLLKERSAESIPHLAPMGEKGECKRFLVFRLR